MDNNQDSYLESRQGDDRAPDTANRQNAGQGLVEVNIGMTFSGGGYRAATFALGALSFLNSIRLDDGRTLLECVTVLSSVSGGSITALSYMLALSKKKPVDEMVADLFNFLCNEDLVTKAMQDMSAEKANPEASLIKIMARIYDEELFDNAVIGDIIGDKKNFIHFPVKHFTALATDFDYSLPFRFRLIEGSENDGTPMRYCVFGNQRNTIGRSIAPHVTLGEVLACSSCFPSGFEPMMYPDDFKLSHNDKLAKGIKKRFGIMDGGLADNQGIEPVLLSENHMYKYRADKSRTDKALDLIIVNDVTSPYMDGFRPSEQRLPTWAGKLTIGRLRNYGLISELIVLLLFIVSVVLGSSYWMGVMSVVVAIVTLANIVGALMKKKAFGAIAKTFVGDRAAFVSHLKFSTAEAMLANRAKSIIMMSSEVFLKRMRQMNYDTIYENEEWRNRTITSTVYELRPGERWKSSVKNKTSWTTDLLIPSDAIQRNSSKAAGMGTTLWFTDKDKTDGIPSALLADGQYTMCYNLLQYIEKIKNNSVNLTSAHGLIIALESQLKAAWNKFQQCPQWMVPKKMTK